MSTPVNCWECDICRTQYPTRQDADKCQNDHTKSESSQVRFCFENLKGFSHRRTMFSRRVPKSVIVKFSDNIGDYARYTFESYGPKGM